MSLIKTYISGTGSYIPEKKVTNADFLNHHFNLSNGEKINDDNQNIIIKFEKITGIKERRYAQDNETSSSMATKAAKRAIEDSGIEKEAIDQIIFAHNFGDIKYDSNQTDQLPSLASKVKHNLKIKNPYCIAYDILYGCPGWVQGIIQADIYIKSGNAKHILIIGAETLSRVVDEHDRDTMIYGDGAGATILSKDETTEKTGIISHKSATFSFEEANYLYMGKPYLKENNETIFMKMFGRKIYEFALKNVPQAMKDCMDQSGIEITQLKKIFIHQANEKMDEAIVDRFYKLYGLDQPKGILPMSIHKLGNSSVATVPTLYDLVLKNKLPKHKITTGDVIMFASVGAGMNVNAIIYKLP